jgi:predicted dehydrogenase
MLRLPGPKSRAGFGGFQEIAANVASTRRLRVGVVGAGLIAQVMHLPHLQELSDRFEVAVLSDLQEEVAATCARRYGIPRTCANWRGIFDDPLDAVIILTSGDHAPIAIEAARRGLHVLVEKPMCFSAAEGADMVAAATASGVTLMTAYNKRYDPAYLRFKDEVAALADPRFLRVTTFESPFPPYVEHYPLVRSAQLATSAHQEIAKDAEAAIAAALPEADDEERWIYRWVLLDTLVHELNAVRGLLGEPHRVEYADLHRAHVTVHLRFGDLPVAIHWIDLPGIARYKMEFGVYSPERRVTLAFPSPFLRNAPSELLIEAGDDSSPRTSSTREILAFESPFKSELVAFHDAATGGPEPPTSGADGLRDVALCQSIVRASRTCAPVIRPSEIAGPSVAS